MTRSTLTQSGSDYSKRPSSSISHVFIDVVDVRSHGGDHSGEASRFRQIRDDLPAFNTRVIVFIDEKGLYYYQDLMVSKVNDRFSIV